MWLSLKIHVIFNSKITSIIKLTNYNRSSRLQCMIHLESCLVKTDYIQSWKTQLSVITEHPLPITTRWTQVFTVCGYTNWRSLKWNRSSCILLEWRVCAGKQWTTLTGSEERVTSICPTQFFLLPCIAGLCQDLVTWPSVQQQALKPKNVNSVSFFISCNCHWHGNTDSQKKFRSEH